MFTVIKWIKLNDFSIMKVCSVLKNSKSLRLFTYLQLTTDSMLFGFSSMTSYLVKHQNNWVLNLKKKNENGEKNKKNKKNPRKINMMPPTMYIKQGLKWPCLAKMLVAPSNLMNFFDIHVLALEMELNFWARQAGLPWEKREESQYKSYSPT